MATGIAPDVLLDMDEVMLLTLLAEAQDRDKREVKLHGG